MIARWTARGIVRRYPQAWRERYEAEVVALIDESPLRWSDVAELLRGLLTERSRELLSSTEHPKRTVFLLGALRYAFGIAFLGSAFAAAIAFRRATGLTVDESPVWFLLILFAAVVGFFYVLWKARVAPPFGPKPVFPPWAAFVFLPPYFVILTGMAWAAGVGQIHYPELGWLGHVLPYSNWFWFGVLAVSLASSLFPGRQLLRALSELANLERGIASAQQLVDGCHEMIAKGVPSPLADAEAALNRLLRSRDDARARLQQLGYRARFRHVEPQPVR